MAEEVEKEEREKKNSKILQFIGISILLAFGIMGIYYLVKVNDRVIGEEITIKIPEGRELGVKRADTELIYYVIQKPFIVNFPKSTGVSLFQVSVAFLTEGVDSMEVLKKHEPMIRNNFLMLISGQVPKELKTKAGKEQLQNLMLEEVRNIMQKVNAKNKIRDVFFTSFVMQ